MAPEGMQLWEVWTGVAGELEYQNAKAGSSSECFSVSNSGKPIGARPAKRPEPVPPLMAKPSAAPKPPLDLEGLITGLSTDVEDPTLIVKVKNTTYRLRMPKDQSVRMYNVGDNVRVKGWPMGTGVLLATTIEVVYDKR